MAVYFCRFVIFLVLRFEDKKMIKNQYSQGTNQPFLLVKGLVDDRKKVDFLKLPLIRQQTGVYKDDSAV